MSDDQAAMYAVTPEMRRAADETVVSLINAALKPLGYKKDANTWRKSNPETVQVLNIQKSTGHAKFYVNLGILIRSIKDIEKPKEYECHIRARLDARHTDPDRGEIAKVMIYNNGHDEEWRAKVFSRVLSERGLPFLSRFTTEADAQAALSNLPLEVALMYNPAPFTHFNLAVPENAFR